MRRCIKHLSMDPDVAYDAHIANNIISKSMNF